MKDLRIVLLGKTGSGKSSTGNTILGRKAFEVGFFSESTTVLSEKHTETLDDRKISVIDTPGLFHTSLTEEELQSEIEKCVEMSAPGPHVFLLVMRLGRYTEEENNAVRWIQENFGDDVMKYIIVLFTGEDKLNKTLDEFLNKSIKLKMLLNECSVEYCSFKNVMKDLMNRAQVSELVRIIDAVVEKNGGQHYTKEMYTDAQRKIREEEERKREEEKKRQALEKRQRNNVIKNVIKMCAKSAIIFLCSYGLYKCLNYLWVHRLIWRKKDYVQ